MIKLVILDVDGVMTDGRKYYDQTGMPVMKTYCDKDFTAIKRLKGAGVKVCILSGDDFVNMAMAKNRNIDFYSARGKDKADFILGFTETYDATPAEMAYIGDDLFDKSVMEAVGYAFCPADSCADIRAVCGTDNTLKNNGGCNVIAEMVDVMLQRKMIPDATMEQIEALDKKEKF
tara:strand:- start:2234 stop:2758 length:525 start_codon:yes stop_codon:yes gene_type:complete